MTRQLGARLGGLTTATMYGSAHLAQIGRLGGLKVSANKQHMAEIGRKGGKA